jgi:tetratricopeptide (TPR) repeat protein
MSEDPQIRQEAVTGNVVGRDLTFRDNNQTTNNNYYQAPSPPKYTPIHNLPYPPSANFVGREGVLTKLHASLQAKTVAAIVGMPGVGKTELALQYAHTNGKKYLGGCYWLGMRDLNLANVLTQHIKREFKLDLPAEINQPREIAQWCWGEWARNLPADSQVLVVLDNVDEAAQIGGMLPGNPCFRLLVTTRTHALVDANAEEKLDELTDAAALQFLGKLVGNLRVSVELVAAKRLCEDLLGNLPLGIELAGRYLQQDEELSIVEFAAELDTLQEALDAEDTRAVYPLMTAERGVKSALELSWRKLTADSQTMGKLLGLCAPRRIPWKLAEDMAKGGGIVATKKEIAKSVKQARQQLANLHLIKWDKQRKTATLHALVRKFLHQKAQSPDSLKQIFADTMLQRARQARHDMNLERVAGMKDMVPHIEEVATHYPHLLSDDDLLRLFIGVARFYDSQGLYFAALPWCELCLETAEQRLGADHLVTATSLNSLATLYSSIGNYKAAEPLYVRALQIKEQQLGVNHPDTATSLNNLANLYSSIGNYPAAEPLYVRALDIHEQQLGANHPSTATILNNLANLYYSIGKYSEALPLYERALDIHEQQLGADHPSTATSLGNLAALYSSIDKYSEALPLYERALQINEQQLGADHPDTAMSLNNLANLYYSMKRFAEAEPLYARAVQICEQSLGTEHPTTVMFRRNYEICLRDKGL